MKTKVDNKEIGKRIRKERESLGLSREEFAELLNLSDYYIGQLERGERQMSLPTLVNISKRFRVTLDYLIFGDSMINNRSVNEYYESYGEITTINKELNALLSKCSKEELVLFKKILKTMLPYIKKAD